MSDELHSGDRTIFGPIYEARFEEALDELKHKGVIDGWEKTEYNSDLDAAGIDYFLIKGNKRIPWQITSSNSHVGHHYKTHPDFRERGVNVTRMLNKNKREDGTIGRWLRPLENVKKDILSKLDL